MTRNLCAVCLFVLLALPTPALHAQLGPRPLLPPATPQFGPCYWIVVQNRGVRIDLVAAASSPYSIALTWSGFAGVYEISSSGPGAPFRESVRLGPATLASPPSSTLEPKFKRPTTPDLFPGAATHVQASPSSQYAYTIVGTLIDGRKACGQAVATTPPGLETVLLVPRFARPLTVATVNVANAFLLSPIGYITWETKMDRLAAEIAASGEVPDIISMTESSGWTSCSSPVHDNSGDYDMVDRLVWRLRDGIGVTYRVAYMVGVEGNFGGVRCHYYTGDTVLYNPNRITNLTPSDVAGRTLEPHNDNFLGFLVRRSLPICSRGARTNIPNLEQLIDGPLLVEKCNRATPSAPVWAWQVQNPNARYSIVATLARFGLVGIPGSSFDVVTTHPTSGEELSQHAPISGFVTALTSPGFRNSRPYYPTIVLGDFNCLIDDENDARCLSTAGGSWPAATALVFRDPEDVMAVALGSTAGALAPLRTIRMVVGKSMPARLPCRPARAARDATGIHYFADSSFSDHCGLIVRFTE